MTEQQIKDLKHFKPILQIEEGLTNWFLQLLRVDKYKCLMDVIEPDDSSFELVLVDLFSHIKFGSKKELEVLMSFFTEHFKGKDFSIQNYAFTEKPIRLWAVVVIPLTDNALSFSIINQ